MANLLDVLREAVNEGDEIYCMVATVDAVDLESRTADVSPINGDAQILGVRLEAGSSDDPFLIIPKVGSVCVVNFLSKETASASMFSEVETILLRGDEFGGLIKINELVDNLAIVSSRIDTLYSAINNAVAVPQDGGASLSASMKATLSTQIQTEDFSNLENENVKHG